MVVYAQKFVAGSLQGRTLRFRRAALRRAVGREGHRVYDWPALEVPWLLSATAPHHARPLAPSQAPPARRGPACLPHWSTFRLRYRRGLIFSQKPLSPRFRPRPRSPRPGHRAHASERHARPSPRVAAPHSARVEGTISSFAPRFDRVVRACVGSLYYPAAEGRGLNCTS